MDWSSLHYSLLWAYEGPVSRSSWTGRFTDDATSCCLIRQGSVKVQTPGETLKARAGDWVFVASPTRHQAFSEDNRILSLHFHLHWPGGEPLVNRARTLVCRADRIPGLEKASLPLIRLLRRHFPGVQSYLPAEPCPRGLYLRIQSLLPSLLDAYLDAQEQLGNPPRLRAGRDELMLQLLAALDRIPLHLPLKQEALARQLGFSRSRLDALFVSRMGITPRRYLEQRRRETAKQMLGNTNKSIKTIALELGFRHESHFCLWFKRLEGCRPGERRQKSPGNSGKRHWFSHSENKDIPR